MYEGTPDTPTRAGARRGPARAWPKDRLWDIIERYGVTQLYTAPTAIRTFMKWGAQEPERHDLSSLRVLGTVGEPINPEAWMWYHRAHRWRALPDRRHLVADRDRRPHDHARCRASPRPSPARPATPLPGIGVEVVDDDGDPVERRRRLPHHHPAVAGDAARHLGRPRALRETYWSRYPGRYFAGDGGQGRRRRLPLGAGPGRRRDERLRAPHLHRRGGVGAGGPPGGGRGRGGRAPPTTPRARPSSAT